MDSTDQILEFLFDTPPEGAVEYLKSQGYEVSGNADDVIKAIQNHAFTVAKVATADKLQKIHDELKKAMDKGTPYKEWLKSVKDTVPGKTNWQTVYRNNMSSAYNGGRYIEQTANTEYAPFWQHQCVMDSVTRPLGRTLNGLIYRYDDPHWSTMYPINEPNDRDMIITLSDFYMQNHPELKVETEPPVDSNGKPYEPAKGYEGNPALTTWKPDLTKYSPEIRSELEKTLGKNGEVDKPMEGVLKTEKRTRIAKTPDFEKFKNDEFDNYVDKAVEIYNKNAEVLKAFRAYSGSSFVGVNQSLRFPEFTNEQSSSIINKMKKDFEIKLDKNIKTYRGTSFEVGADTIQSNALSKLYDDLLNGKIKKYKDKAFFSTSLDPTVADEMGAAGYNEKKIIFEVGLPKKANVGVGTQWSEQELILPPDSEFDIINVIKVGEDSIKVQMVLKNKPIKKV